MTARVRIAALFTFLAGTALLAGQNPPQPAPNPPPAARPADRATRADAGTDVSRPRRLRGGGCRRHGSGGQSRPRSEEGGFQVLEDGKAQTITTFSLVDIPIERADRPLYQPDPIEPDVKTNAQPFDGRIYVMVIDDTHTNAGRTARVKGAAKQFIQRRLGANDLMAVVHTFGATSSNQEFTSNKRLLLAAVDKTMGRKLLSATANKTASTTAPATSASRATR